MRLRAFGMTVELELVVPGLEPAPVAPDPAPLTVRLATAGELDSAWSGPRDPVAVAHRRVDERPLTIERGRGGDRLVTWGGEGRFHLAADGALLLCWTADDEPGPRWLRVLLDSALGVAALSRGAEALHAGAVVVDGRAVAVLGDSGAGKTSLVAALMSAGHRLLCDDVLVVEPAGEAVLGHPGPPVMNLPRAMASGRYGSVLAELDDEAWIAVRGTAAAPAPLAAMIWAGHEAGEGEAALVPVTHPAQPILASLLHSGADPARRLRRLEVGSRLAEGVPLLRARGGPRPAPHALASLVASALADGA